MQINYWSALMNLLIYLLFLEGHVIIPMNIGTIAHKLKDIIPMDTLKVICGI